MKHQGEIFHGITSVGKPLQWMFVFELQFGSIQNVVTE